jgi:hypothetical protein
LELTNIHPIYGMLGSPRPDLKVLPGDILVVAFDIENIRVGDGGEVAYSMALELLDAKQKTQYKQEPQELRALNSLGGSRVPAFAHTIIGLDQEPGKYTLRVTVTDRAAKQSKSFERSFEVLPPAFGLVRAHFSVDSNGNIAAPSISVPGQTLWLNFFAVGFERSPKKEPDILVEMRVLDENGKAVLAKPFVGDVKELPAADKAIPMVFALSLNRTGKFTVKLKAVDNVSKKTSELSLPITVMEAK